MAKPKMRDLLKKKEVQEGKEADLEKGDFLAIIIAAASVFIPAILIVIAFLFVFIKVWTIIF